MLLDTLYEKRDRFIMVYLLNVFPSKFPCCPPDQDEGQVGVSDATFQRNRSVMLQLKLLHKLDLITCTPQDNRFLFSSSRAREKLLLFRARGVSMTAWEMNSWEHVLNAGKAHEMVLDYYEQSHPGWQFTSMILNLFVHGYTL